jgi:predicted metallopeptidase
MVGSLYRLETTQLNTTISSFRNAIRQLRILTPPVWGVKVRRAPLADSHGDCSLVAREGKTPYYAIRVSSDLSEEAQVLVLMHEWAHALSWGTDSHRVRAHGPEWGLAMSRIWQGLMED